MELYEVIRRPLVTEKNTTQGTLGKYGFEVARGAGKHEIKLAVEKAFGVSVTGVNVMIVPGKERRVGKRAVKTPEWKKAIVTLKPGDKITLFAGV